MKRVLASMLLIATLLVVATGPAVARAEADRATNFGSVLAVKFDETFPIASLMRVDCAFVQRVQLPDGSAQEVMQCTLSDEPVMIPEFQGQPPDRAVRYSGPPCLWASNYWFAKAGIIVFADGFDVVVTPAGRVRAIATFPAEPLDCS